MLGSTRGGFKPSQAFTSKARGMGTAMVAPISLPTLLQRRRPKVCSHPPEEMKKLQRGPFQDFSTL